MNNEETINVKLHEILNEIIGKGPEALSDKYFVYKVIKVFPKYMEINLKESDTETNKLTIVTPIKENNNYKIYHLYKGKYVLECLCDDYKRIVRNFEITEDMYGQYYFSNIVLEGGKSIYD